MNQSQIKRSIYDKNLQVQRHDINLSTFSYLYSEIINYYLQKFKLDEMDRELEKLGEIVGPKLFELIIYRDKSFKRELKHIEILKFLHSNVWKVLFGRNADSLEKVKDKNGEYMIKTFNLPLMKFMSESQMFNPISFLVGIVKAILLSAGFGECKVKYWVDFFDQKIQETAQQAMSSSIVDKGLNALNPISGQLDILSVIIVEFPQDVISREQ